MADAAAALVSFLQFGGAAAPLWQLVVWASVAYLTVLGSSALFARRYAKRFLDGFASTTRANALEACLRFVAGIGFIGASPALRHPTVFVIAGLVLAITALPMLALPGLHKRYAGWVAPLVGPMLPVIGVTSLLLAAGIAYAATP